MRNIMQKNHTRLQLIMAGVLLLIVSIVAVNGRKIVKEKPDTGNRTGIEKTESVHKGKSIIIDPGHGGDDPGKVGLDGQLEKDINLQIAQKLKEVLEHCGYAVVLTREEDVHLGAGGKMRKTEDLNRRCAIVNDVYAKDSEAVMISIHQNSFRNESVYGAQCFYYKKSEKSKQLAEMIQKKINEKINTHKAKNTKGNDSYYMLINSQCPAIILECGFLSNPEEARRLREEQYQYELTEVIKDGIDDYYGAVL